MSELPRWHCHKEVFADKIAEIQSVQIRVGMGTAVDIQLFLDSGQSVTTQAGFGARGLPAIGDYYVRYDDGYESWSPAKAFESGYTRL